MANIKIAPPWIQFKNELGALFAKDPEVTVAYDNDTKVVKLFVQNQRKADALTRLLPSEKRFGNVSLGIEVIPENHDKDIVALIKDAFAYNEAVSEIWTTDDTITTNPITYVIFQKEVVQYYDDNLGDAHGNRTTLYQDIARDVFEDRVNGVFFCTDNK